jgi:inorganic triphosphatase YgiF
MFDEDLLRESTERGVQLIGLSLIADARHACAGGLRASHGLPTEDGESAKALHDFRVAVRRLRSWIRAFKPHLRGSVSPGQRRRLSKIAHATSAVRDATVHLECLDRERRALNRRQCSPPRMNSTPWTRSLQTA